jgi:hypothetical protein
MNDIGRYDVTKKDLAKGRNLKIAAWSTPILLGGVPAVIFLFLLFIFGSTPPVAATIFFLGIIISLIGFIIGLGLTGFFLYRHGNWTREMRERIAADGIKAEEIEWFTAELKSSEKRALSELKRKDLLLADAYRETLASRLTASRIVKSSKKELLLAQRRKNRVKYSKSESSKEFQEQILEDISKIGSINNEAKQMLGEAEARLQMIEAAAARGIDIADSELALKKLSARTAELPLALRAAQMEDEVRKEIEAENASDEQLLPQTQK